MLALLFTLLSFQKDTAEYIPLSEAIPETVWRLTQDPSRHIMDAIVVKDITRIRANEIDHYQMVRILSAGGKAAMANILLHRNLTHFEGQVVDISGDKTTFDKKQDLTKVLGYKAGDKKLNHILLIPPGLTPNCVFELSWSEKAEYGLPKEVSGIGYSIPEPFYCLEKIFQVDNTTLFQFTKSSDKEPDLATRLRWKKISAPALFDGNSLGEYSTLTYKNVPAMRTFPFGDHNSDVTMAEVQVFRTLNFEGISSETFWNGFSQLFLRSYYGLTWQVDHAYGAWIKHLRSGIGSPTVASAEVVFNKFREKFTRVDLMTQEQRASVFNGSLERVPMLADMLNEITEHGYIYPEQSGILLYEAMADLGFKPYLIFAPLPGVDFDPKDMNPSQIDMFHPLLGFKSGEGWMTFGPAFPEYETGQMPAQFRDVPLLVTQPLENFKTTFIKLKRPDWKQNQLLQMYNYNLTEDGTAQFSVSERSQGVFNAQRRAKYRHLSSEEQGESFLAEWQERLPQYSLSSPEVTGVANYTDKITCRLKGARVLDLSGQFLELNVFPGAKPIFPIPKVWPADRTQPIVLPDNRGQLSRCTLTLPPGWDIVGNPSWSRENLIGKVHFKVLREGDTLKFERQVTVEKSLLETTDEPLLKAFFSWVTNIQAQRITLARRKP